MMSTSPGFSMAFCSAPADGDRESIHAGFIRFLRQEKSMDGVNRRDHIGTNVLPLSPCGGGRKTPRGSEGLAALVEIEEIGHVHRRPVFAGINFGHVSRRLLTHTQHGRNIGPTCS